MAHFLVIVSSEIKWSAIVSLLDFVAASTAMYDYKKNGSDCQSKGDGQIPGSRSPISHPLFTLCSPFAHPLMIPFPTVPVAHSLLVILQKNLTQKFHPLLTPCSPLLTNCSPFAHPLLAHFRIWPTPMILLLGNRYWTYRTSG